MEKDAKELEELFNITTWIWNILEEEEKVQH